MTKLSTPASQSFVSDLDIRISLVLWHSSLVIFLPSFSRRRLELDNIMRLAFALTGRADADEPGLLAQLGQIRRAQISHARLNTANELGQHLVQRASHFLQCFHPFRG